MKKNGTYFKIGLFVIGICAVLIAGILFISADTLRGDTILMETYINESVQGLSVGSDVLYRGVNVGRVKKITFAPLEYPMEIGSPEFTAYSRYVVVIMDIDPQKFPGLDRNPTVVESMIRNQIKEGLRFIQSHPYKALRLLGKKAIMFWNRFEIPDNYNYYYYRQKASVLSVLFLGFGFVAPLGLLGLFLARKNPGTFLFALFILGYMASIVPFHMASRYRLPIVTPLIVFASYALAKAVEAFRLRQFRSLSLALLWTGLLATAVNWKVVDEKATFKAPYTELGIIAAEKGNFTEAMAYFKDALHIDPGYAPAYYNMGNILAKQGAFEKAAKAFEEALKNDPEFLAALENLVKSYFRLGKMNEALSAFDRALRLRPDLAEAFVGKGIVFHSLGRYAEAIDAYKKAIALRPALGAAYYNLSCAYAKKGEIDRARFALKKAEAINSDYEQKARVDRDLAILRDNEP